MDPGSTWPVEVRRLFWDHEPGELTWPRDADLVVERLVTRGGLASWRWLRLRMTDDGRSYAYAFARQASDLYLFDDS